VNIVILSGFDRFTHLWKDLLAPSKGVREAELGGAWNQ
jgi:hypothetical protein